MKYALITGATSGIGKSYAEKLASKGYNLILTGRRVDVITDVAKKINDEYGVQIELVIADFSKKADVDKLLQAIQGKDIEFLVNNVGFGHKEKFLDDSYETQKTMIDVQIDATCRIIHKTASKMKDKRKGYIVNVSSLAAYTPAKFNHMYSASKMFINNFSESLHLELDEHNVKVQSLCPGFTKTDFHRDMNIEESTYKNRGLVRWMEAGQVVEESYNEVIKRGGIYIPGLCNKFLYFLRTRLTKRFYYKIAKEMKM